MYNQRYTRAAQRTSIFFLQRKQRRWTVCPMGAHRKPLLELDLPLGEDFGRPSKRLEQTFAGSPSKGLDRDNDIVTFKENDHQRFLEEMQERESETDTIADHR